MKYRRKKSRRNVRCVLCTDSRYGNSKAQLRPRDMRNEANARDQFDTGVAEW